MNARSRAALVGLVTLAIVCVAYRCGCATEPLKTTDLEPMALQFDQHVKDAGQHVGKAQQGVNDAINSLTAILVNLKAAKVEGTDPLSADLDLIVKDFAAYEEAATACQVWCKKEHATLLALYEGAKTRIGLLEGQIAELQQQLKQANANKAELQAKIVELTDKLAAAQGDATAMQQQLAALKAVVKQHATALLNAVE